MHAALFLVVVLAGGAAQFILLGQEFVAWVQVLVYIGAVIVLFLFGIMLTRAPMHPEESLDNDLRWPGAAAVAVPGRRSSAACSCTRSTPTRSTSSTPVRTPQVTNAIFRVYIIPFEVVGVLLLGALIGAVVLARKRLMLLNQFLLLGAFLFCTGDLRRAHAQAHGARAHEHRADARGRQHQPRRVRRVPQHDDVVGQVFALFVLTIAAAEVGVGLAIVLLIYRNLHSADLDDVDALKG